MTVQELIDELIMALNGSDFESASSIYGRIKSTGDAELIRKADKVYNL